MPPRVSGRRTTLAVAVAAACALGGCAVGPDFHRPEPALPAAYPSVGSVAQGAQAPDPGAWWRAMGDRDLDDLVERALRGNPGLEAALARLQAAQALVVAQTGVELPSIVAASGGGHGTGGNLARGGRVPGALHAADQSTAAIAHITQVSGFDAAWDFDLFGRLRREAEAARADAHAMAAARDATQVALVADVVASYLELRGSQTGAAVLRQNVEAAQKLLDLVQARFERGITNELDVTLARRQLAAAQAELAPLEAQAVAARDRVAALVGGFPGDLPSGIAAPGVLPALPAAVDPGQPLEILRRRPDIRIAEWQLAGATARVGVAVGDLFPRIGLSAGVGRQRGALAGDGGSELQSIWSVGYGVTLPLLDFGTLDALVQVADLDARAALLRYRETVLRAFEEVDAAAAAYHAQQDRLRSLGEAVVAGQRAMALASERYDRGLTDFLNVIDAQRQEYALEAQYAAAQLAAGQQFVALYRALGGGWERFEAPSTPWPQPALMAMFRRLVQPAPALTRAAFAPAAGAADASAPKAASGNPAP